MRTVDLPPSPITRWTFLSVDLSNSVTLFAWTSLPGPGGDLISLMWISSTSIYPEAGFATTVCLNGMQILIAVRRHLPGKGLWWCVGNGH